MNLDILSLALYSTNVVPGLSLNPVTNPNGLALRFDTIPELAYRFDWKSSLSAGVAWQPFTNFTGNGNTNTRKENVLNHGWTRMDTDKAFYGGGRVSGAEGK